MPNVFMNCELDEAANLLLQDWYAEIRATEASIAAQEVVLAAQITDATRTAKVKASYTFGTLPFGWVKVERKVAGTEGNSRSFAFLANAYSQTLSLTITGNSVTVFLATGAPVPVTVDPLGDYYPPAVLSTPQQVYNLLINPIYNLTNDFNFSWGGITPSFSMTPYPTTFLTGGKNAAIVSCETALNTLINTSGHTTADAYGVTGTPYVTTADTPAQAMAKISDKVQLSSGKLFEIFGTNLNEVRSLWTLLSGDTDTVYSLLPGADGTPIVIWTKQVTTILPLPDCDGKGTTTSTKTVVVGSPNDRLPVAGLTPNVWWRKSITPAVATVNYLYTLGLTQDQVNTALDPSASTTHVIEDQALTTTFSLTVSDLAELMGISSLAGIASVVYEVALATLPPASAANGWNSPAWSLPGGATARDNLSPSIALAADVAKMANSPCIDLIGKGLIATFVAAASAPIDMVTRVAERVRNAVKPVLDRISGILSKAQGWMDKFKAPGCILGVDFSFDIPSIDFLLLNLELIAPDIKGFIDTIEGIFKTMTPKLCQIETVVTDLIGPLLPEDADAVCLAKGLTNFLVNQAGRLKGLLPCVNNPFDALRLLTQISDKIAALTALLNSMLKDLRLIVSQINMLTDITVESPTKAQTITCNNAALATLSKRIKSTFGV